MAFSLAELIRDAYKEGSPIIDINEWDTEEHLDYLLEEIKWISEISENRANQMKNLIDVIRQHEEKELEKLWEHFDALEAYIPKKPKEGRNYLIEETAMRLTAARTAFFRLVHAPDLGADAITIRTPEDYIKELESKVGRVSDAIPEIIDGINLELIK